MDEHPKQKGTVSEAKVLHELVERGFTVCEPFGDNERYDYIVDDGDDLYRIQVKTGTDNGNGSFRFNVDSTYLNSGGYSKTDYSGEIDFFVVYAPDTDDFAWVPIDEAGNSTMTICYDVDRSHWDSVNFISKYRLPEAT